MFAQIEKQSGILDFWKKKTKNPGPSLVDGPVLVKAEWGGLAVVILRLANHNGYEPIISVMAVKELPESSIFPQNDPMAHLHSEKDKKSTLAYGSNIFIAKIRAAVQMQLRNARLGTDNLGVFSHKHMSIRKFADLEYKLRKLAVQNNHDEPDDEHISKIKTEVIRHFNNNNNNNNNIDGSEYTDYVYNQGRSFVDLCESTMRKITGTSEIYTLCDVVLDDFLNDDSLSENAHLFVYDAYNEDLRIWEEYLAGIISRLKELGYLRQEDIDYAKYSDQITQIISKQSLKKEKKEKKDDETWKLYNDKWQKQKEHTEYVTGFNAASKNNISLDEQLNLLVIVLRDRSKPQSSGIITGLTANDSVNSKIKPILTMINNGNLNQAQTTLNNIFNDPLRNATLPKTSWP